MFETSVVNERSAATAERVRMLTVSIFAHSAVVVGAIAVSIASVDFPSQAPAEYSRAPAMHAVTLPPPLGTPDGGATAKPAEPAQPKPAPAVTPTEITAPASVPDNIAPVESRGGETPLNGNGEASGAAAGPLGVPWGVEGSVGDLNAPPVTTTTPPVDEKIYEAAEVNAPVIVHRVDPPYPAVMMRTRMSATVVVRCIIDRNGAVRDPRVIAGSLPPFNDAVIEAVKKWRFRPGSHNGRAVETYLNLTVHFSVAR